MSRRRALLTDRERELIADEDAGSQRYVAVSRIRTKIADELTEDIRILSEHHPELHDELREVVCEDVDEVGIADADSSPDGETAEPAPERTRNPEPEGWGEDTEDAEDDRVPTPGVASTRVWEVVDGVAASWADDDRLENRKHAAAEVLQHARETGEGVGRSSEILDEVREKYPVEGQSEETFWRRNIRPVLKEVGDYSRGTKQYTVSSLDAE